jgi:hypothetical protein
MSTAGPPRGRPRVRGEAKARSARPRMRAAADAQLLALLQPHSEAANRAPSGGSAAATAASVGVHQ